jgi:hypothetical protein
MHPVDIELIAVAAMSAGGIIFFGALYAVFYALGRLGRNHRLVQFGYAGYAGLLSCTWLLTHSLQLSGIWLALVACLLVGYLVAPPFIWRLSVATHATEAHTEHVEAKAHE